jgi:hypothetical protein
LEGYTSAQIVVKALRQLDEPPTRETIVDALEQLGDFAVCTECPLHLDAEQHQACHRVWPTIIQGGNVHPIEWSELRLPEG